MLNRSSIAIIALATLCLAGTSAQAFDESKYPDWSGQWRRGEPGPPRYDPSKPGAGLRQEAPLTDEYKRIHAESMADQKDGGPGNDPTYTCIGPGMPRIMSVYDPLEIVITENTTHMLMQHVHDSRRTFTDGRNWPEYIEPSFAGYSIGKWLDTDGDGRYDTLEIETRNMKGPRAFDNSGALLHKDNETIVKERLYGDKTKADSIFNEVTTIDKALTRPWTVTKNYLRVKNPTWPEDNCSENNNHVEINGEGYFFSADGYLMPTRKDQPPPDLRYFKPASR